MNRRAPAPVAVATLLIALAACGEAEPVEPVAPVRVATLPQLVGPWQPFPMRLDPAMWGRVQQACLRDIESPPGSAAIIIDARGASVVTVRISGQHSGSCDSLEIARDGQVLSAGAGWRAEGPERLLPIGDGELGGIEKQSVQGGSLTIEGWSVYGRAGAAIQTVMVEPLNHPAITATLMNGWFAAWWPARQGDPPRGGQDIPPFVVRGYDALGVVLAEIEP